MAACAEMKNRLHSGLICPDWSTRGTASGAGMTWGISAILLLWNVHSAQNVVNSHDSRTARRFAERAVTSIRGRIDRNIQSFHQKLGGDRIVAPIRRCSLSAAT